MNWFKRLWFSIISINDQPFIDEINNLELSIKDLQHTNSMLNSKIDFDCATIDLQDEEILLLNLENNSLHNQILLLTPVEVSKPGWLNDVFGYKPQRRFVSKNDDRRVYFKDPRDVFDKSVYLHRLMKEEGLLGMERTLTNAVKIHKWVVKQLSYQSDDFDNWRPITETLLAEEGDCVAEYERIYTEEGVKEIKDVQVGDVVLSYDFEKKDFVYKKVLNKWNKGKLQINRVHLRNGQWVDVSENHLFWCKQHQTNSNYFIKKLSEIDLTKWQTRKIPIAKKIPYKKSTPKFPKELYLAIGHYVAEGWINGRNVNSSGKELIDYIIPVLEKHNIPFTEYTNNSGVPCIRYLKSEFKEYLKPLLRNSFDITLYEELITLPEEYLEELLYGMWLGDGTKNAEPSGKEWIYATSSQRLAKDIQRIGLHLGRTFHIWKQERHGGVGTKPIYRITYTSKSNFLKDYDHASLSEVSIRYIEKLDEVQMYDIEVEDTHTFVFENGLLSHNCEDASTVLTSAFGLAGWKEDEVFMGLGWMYYEGKSNNEDNKVYHAWCNVKVEGKWYLSEGTDPRSTLQKWSKSTIRDKYSLTELLNWKFKGRLVNWNNYLENE